MNPLIADIRNLIGIGAMELAARLINHLPNADRVTLRERLEREGLPMPRNLYFNYQTQTWIG